MKKILDGYYKVLKVTLTVLMIFLIIPVTMQILARYLGVIPRYIWTEELARFSFIWIVMIGSMIALRDNEHFTVDLLPKTASKKLNALSDLFVDLTVLLMALIFIVWGWPLVEFGLLQTSEMAELPMVLIYMAWPITGVTWALFLAERIIGHIKTFRSQS